MNEKTLVQTREFLREEMERLLPRLDAVTIGDHPIWDKRFSDIMAEVVLQVILAGNLVEEYVTKDEPEF